MRSRLAVAVGILALCALKPMYAQLPTSETQPSATDSVDCPAPAYQPPACWNASEQAQFAQRFVNERLVEWQRELKLEDWQISAVMTRRSEMKAKTLGGIRWDKRKKKAVMWVRDPSDYRLPFPEMLRDMEFTVVHELVHLELASLPRSEASRGSEEHAVNRITEALMKLGQR